MHFPSPIDHTEFFRTDACPSLAKTFFIATVSLFSYSVAGLHCTQCEDELGIVFD